MQFLREYYTKNLPHLYQPHFELATHIKPSSLSKRHNEWEQHQNNLLNTINIIRINLAALTSEPLDMSNLHIATSPF